MMQDVARFQQFQIETDQPSSGNGLDKVFGSLSIIDEDGIMCLPPLDLVTVTGSDDDDASSVSSMSSNVEDFDAPPRSMFKAYWEKNGSRSSFSSISDRSGHKRRLSKELTTFEAYEHSLSSSSLTEEDKTSASSSRRKIFGNSGGCSFTRSEPYLSSTARLETDAGFRKSLSTSAICSKPKSCLRYGRFSDRQARRESSSSTLSSVSFKQGVQVVVYQLPIEQHAQKGWSKFFV